MKKTADNKLVLRPQKGAQTKFLKTRDDIYLVFFGGGAI